MWATENRERIACRSFGLPATDEYLIDHRENVTRIHKLDLEDDHSLPVPREF